MAFREIGYARFAQEFLRGIRQAQSGWTLFAQHPLPSVLSHANGLLWSYVAPEYQRRLERAMIDRFLAEVDATLAAIPHHELAIQWDTPHDLLTQEGARDMVLDTGRDDLVRRWAGIAEHIPSSVDLGFHFCYGDSNSAHAVEPRDAGLMTEFANALTRGLPRDISYIHMPVPRNRNDEAFFAPLKNAQWKPATELYLGLVHLRDGVEGASQRIRAAAAARGAFGIATECGFGRQPPELGEAAVAAPRRDRRFELFKLLRLAAAVPAVLALAVLGQPAEFQIGEEAVRRTPPGVAAVAAPGGQFLQRHIGDAAAVADPVQPVAALECRDVGQPAVLVALQPHAAAARHLRHLIERENHHLAVLADRRGQLALHRRDRRGLVRRLDVEHLLALAGVGEALVLGHDEAAALCCSPPGICGPLW